MLDSIYPDLLPAGDYAYAGYVNGRWPDYPAIKAKFPHSDVLSIAVNAGSNADCLDVETGDATVSDVASWVTHQLGSGAVRPCLYASVSLMPAVIRQVQALWSYGRIRVWTAHYGTGKHICGPSTCKMLAVPADGTQWADSFSGQTIDVSVLLDNFFGSIPVPPPPSVPTWEITMMNSLPVVQSGDTGTAVRRVQGLCLAALPTATLKIDGNFGPATTAAIKNIQAQNHITADGIVGPVTWQVLVTGSS